MEGRRHPLSPGSSALSVGVALGILGLLVGCAVCSTVAQLPAPLEFVPDEPYGEAYWLFFDPIDLGQPTCKTVVLDDLPPGHYQFGIWLPPESIVKLRRDSFDSSRALFGWTTARIRIRGAGGRSLLREELVLRDAFGPISSIYQPAFLAAEPPLVLCDPEPVIDMRDAGGRWSVTSDPLDLLNDDSGGPAEADTRFVVNERGRYRIALRLVAPSHELRGIQGKIALRAWDLRR